MGGEIPPQYYSYEKLRKDNARNVKAQTVYLWKAKHK